MLIYVNYVHLLKRITVSDARYLLINESEQHSIKVVALCSVIMIPMIIVDEEILLKLLPEFLPVSAYN